jgi:acetyl esterase/lipase
MHAQNDKQMSITYLHESPQSINALFVKAGAKIFLPKKSINRKLKRDNFVSESAPIPKKYLEEFQVDTFQVNGRNVYKISPTENASAKCIFYLHGGAYINNIFGGHWDFIAQLVRNTGCSVIIPDYPLAPTSSYVEAFAMLDEIYTLLLLETDSQDIIFMGDSAGGGLALAFAEKNSVENMPSPSQIILISPWLDVSMTNPGIEDIRKKDPILNPESLVLAGNSWAGNSDTKNYLVSPIYGNLKGLSNISIFIGTHDVLYPDCVKLKSLLEQQNIRLNYYEYPKMFHVWVFFSFIKESKRAQQQIMELILE